MRIFTILTFITILVGCASTDSLKEFTKNDAILIADSYLKEKHILWGKPSKIILNKLNVKTVQYTLYYETPSGEETRLGKRGLTVSQSGKV